MAPLDRAGDNPRARADQTPAPAPAPAAPEMLMRQDILFGLFALSVVGGAVGWQAGEALGLGLPEQLMLGAVWSAAVLFWIFRRGS